jgi:uncharacterized membrane protein
MKDRSAWEWIKIGILIGIGIGAGLLMISPIFWPIGLVLLFLYLLASSWTKFREWRMVREAVRGTQRIR